MRRFYVCLITVCLAVMCLTSSATAQQAADVASNQAGSSKLAKLPVPALHAREIATKLGVRYRDIPGVSISPDVRNQQLVVMAPETAHAQIASDVRQLVAGAIRRVSATEQGPLQLELANITWREFEDSLQRIGGPSLPVTTSRNGERASFQLNSQPITNTTIEVDRRVNSVTVVAPEVQIDSWKRLIESLDQTRDDQERVLDVVTVRNAEPAPIQKAIRLLGNLDESTSLSTASDVGQDNFEPAFFQPQQAAAPAPQPPAGQIPPGALPGEDAQQGDEEDGAGVLGDLDIEFVPELGVIVVRGARRDVQRVRELIDEIEAQAEITQPKVEVLRLSYADSNAVAALLSQLYEDVLSARQGEVSITALDTPNALLLIGREEAINTVRDLVQKIDQPVPDTDRTRVFRLQYASAVDAEETIRSFFTDLPGEEDELRPGIGYRVRVLADYRTNSLIVSAAPRDMDEVTRLINELDVQEIPASSEIKIFYLDNARAEDLAPTIQAAISGEIQGELPDNVTTPSQTLSLVTVDAEGQRTLDSGLLETAQVYADENSNALVVTAPSSSMPLIAELIRQLDRSPQINSFVKVFTIQNGDATQLTQALQSLFGDAAATGGTAVGGANVAALAAATAAESALVPLRFTTDIRSNSIIASGSAEDLEVVESILLRLDNQGFAERITEVIWLRHQPVEAVAAALQDYVLQRTQSQTTIQQFQQGLGPFDLLDRDLIIAPEITTNSLIISVEPRLYEDVRRLIDQLDRRPPMVLIKVVIAEVRLDDRFEIGGEVGLQDSLLFDRGIAALAPPVSQPGFNFNNVSLPNENTFAQESLAGRGVTSFGLGTTSTAAGVGGFVLSAASESVNVLFRALQTAGRLQIISRPNVMVQDNTDGFIQVGQLVARPQNVVVNLNATTIGVEDIEVGLILAVRPRVGSDGLIVMQIDATRSDVNRTEQGQVIGVFEDQPVVVPPIDRTFASSTISAYSGQTVVYGGLIQKQRENVSRRVPYLADIPLLGTFFKFDQETAFRSELLVVMTPTLVTGEQDLNYVKQVESSRMSWCLADVVEAHGDVGLSGGYGLWGPPIGPTIYPDLQPTVDDVINGYPMKRADRTFPTAVPEMVDGVPVPAAPPIDPDAEASEALPADPEMVTPDADTFPATPGPRPFGGYVPDRPLPNTRSPQAAPVPPAGVQGIPPAPGVVPPEAQGIPPRAQGIPPRAQGVPPRAQGVPPGAPTLPQGAPRVPPNVPPATPQRSPGLPQGTPGLPENTPGLPDTTPGLPRSRTPGLPQSATPIDADSYPTYLEDDSILWEPELNAAASTGPKSRRLAMPATARMPAGAVRSATYRTPAQNPASSPTALPSASRPIARFARQGSQQQTSQQSEPAIRWSDVLDETSQPQRAGVPARFGQPTAMPHPAAQRSDNRTSSSRQTWIR